MRKMLFIFTSCLLFMSIYAEDIKIFLTNTYFDNPYYLYKELDKSDTAIGYKGTDKVKYYEDVEYPSFIETKDYIFRDNIFYYSKIEKK